MQFQADLVHTPVLRPAVSETTALGAAYLAGLAVGYWQGLADVEANWALDRRFTPAMSALERERRYNDWTRAVERSADWAID
jgi:glycerol kinase